LKVNIFQISGKSRWITVDQDLSPKALAQRLLTHR